MRKITQATKAAAGKLEEGPKATLEQAADAFSEKAEPDTDAKVWAAAMKTAGEALGVALATADAELTDKQDEILTDLTDFAEEILNDDTAHQAARNWVTQKLPTFVYLADYPEIEGIKTLPSSSVANRKTHRRLQILTSGKCAVLQALIQPDCRSW